MIVVFVFIFGLFVGSFLNVVIFRLHRQESFISGASKCLFCGHRLYPRDLVPLFSYLYLKGRCRYCRRRFSGQYPTVELITGLIFALIFVKIIPRPDIAQLYAGQIIRLIDWWVIAAFLIVIFVYDLKYYLILDKVILPAIFFVFIVNVVLGFNVFNLLLSGAVGGGFFLLQFLVSSGRWIGGGDIRLGVLMGFILGWPQVLVALFIAYVVGSLFSIMLLIGGQKKWADKIPFGTFLTVATFVTMLFGYQLVGWYRSLFLW